MADRARFERLALPLQRDLHFGALALAKSEPDALDLVQETFLRAYRSFSTYRDDQNFRGWMFTILRNAYLDDCRRRRIAPVILQLDAGSQDAPTSSPLGAVSDALSDNVLRALHSLSAAHRLVLLLVDVEHLSYREAADALGCPIGSIMSSLHNARGRLRDALAKAPTT